MRVIDNCSRLMINVPILRIELNGQWNNSDVYLAERFYAEDLDSVNGAFWISLISVILINSNNNLSGLKFGHLRFAADILRSANILVYFLSNPRCAKSPTSTDDIQSESVDGAEGKKFAQHSLTGLR